MAVVDVRRLAALDLHGMEGHPRRRPLVLSEFLAVTVLGLVFGVWILVRTTVPAGLVVGGWAVGIGFNYLPLALHALSLLRPGALDAELARVDIAKELRRYSLLQAWVLVPFLLTLLAVQQLRAPRAT